MNHHAHYIDTRPNAPGLYGAPVPCDDYAAWLMEQYRKGLMRGTHEMMPYGVRQSLTMVIFSHIHEAKPIVILGPYASEAAEVVRVVAREMGEHQPTMEIVR